jgi:hypothetical protein
MWEADDSFCGHPQREIEPLMLMLQKLGQACRATLKLWP